MVEPYVTLTEPSSPQRYRPVLSAVLVGITAGNTSATVTAIRDTSPIRGRCRIRRWPMQFVKDVLLREAIDQYIMEHQPGVHEDAYHGHGPVFTEHCNRIGAELGLAKVVVSNRRGERTRRLRSGRIAKPNPIGMAGRGIRTKNVSPLRVSPSLPDIASYQSDQNLARGIPGNRHCPGASDDSRMIYLDVEEDLAWKLADFITEHLGDEQTDGEVHE